MKTIAPYTKSVSKKHFIRIKMFYFWTESQQRGPLAKGAITSENVFIVLWRKGWGLSKLSEVEHDQTERWKKIQYLCVGLMYERIYIWWAEELAPPLSMERRRTSEKDIQIHPHLDQWPLWKYPTFNQNLHISWAGRLAPERLNEVSKHSRRWHLTLLALNQKTFSPLLICSYLTLSHHLSSYCTSFSKSRLNISLYLRCLTTHNCLLSLILNLDQRGWFDQTAENNKSLFIVLKVW